MSGAFIRLWALSGAERRMLLAAAACMPLFWLGLRVWGLPRFQAWLHRARVRHGQAMTLEEMQALGKLVNIAALRTIGSTSCLTRSLVLQWLLHRRGVESQLRIGVSLTQRVLSAHAWVEFEGIPINDRADVSSAFPPFADPVPLPINR